MTELNWTDHTAQCLSHGNAFLRLYFNDYNCNKSCLGICSSRLVPLISQQLYLSPRDVSQNEFSLADLVLKLSQDVCLGKGSGETCTALTYSFYLFSAASWKVYDALLKLVRLGLLPVPLAGGFLYLFTLIKLCYTKLWATETCVFWVPEWNFLLRRPWMDTGTIHSMLSLSVGRSLVGLSP